MFYYFYIGANCLFDEIEKYTRDFLENNCHDHGNILRSTEEELVISFDWATVSVKEGGQELAFTSEDYQMNLNYSFWIDILQDNDNWAERLMSFVGYLLTKLEEDCVLESNGDTPIVMRRNGNLVVDDKKLKGTERFPFYALNHHFVEGDIEQV